MINKSAFDPKEPGLSDSEPPSPSPEVPFVREPTKLEPGLAPVDAVFVLVTVEFGFAAGEPWAARADPATFAATTIRADIATDLRFPCPRDGSDDLVRPRSCSRANLQLLRKTMIGATDET